MKIPVFAVVLSALGAEGFAPSSAFSGARVGSTAAARSTTAVEMSVQDEFKKAATGALAIFAGLSLFTASPTEAITRDEIDSLSYLQVKGTGLANRCPEVLGEGTISVGNNAKIVDMCIEPKNFQVLSKVGTKGIAKRKGIKGTNDVQRTDFMLKAAVPHRPFFFFHGHMLPLPAPSTCTLRSM